MCQVRLSNNANSRRFRCVLGLVLSVCLYAVTGVWGQSRHFDTPTLTSEKLQSRSVAGLFYRHAYDLVYGGEGDDRAWNEAVTYLMAARELDPYRVDVSLVLFDIAAETNDEHLRPIVLQWLMDCPRTAYDKPAVRRAIRYLLGQEKKRAGVERVAVQLMQMIGDGFPVLQSELLTHLGLAALKRPDKRGADTYFLKAYEIYKYNKLAFAKLAEIAPDRVNASMTLEHLRLSVRENPLDLDLALAFAQYAERLGFYDIAMGGYTYCANLYAYLYEEERLPGHLYIPWAISAFNSERSIEQVSKITDRVRKAGTFDLFLEAIAGQALIKQGKNSAGLAVLQDAEQKALTSLESPPTDPVDAAEAIVSPKALAWFYCFGLENPSRALNWANKAYTIDPNSAATKAVLAYTLVMNQQYKWAKGIIEDGQTNQIQLLARGRLHLAENQVEQGIADLKAAIDRDPGSLAAHRARMLLAAKGMSYQSPQLVNRQEVLGNLVNSLGERLVPVFTPPNQILKLRMATMNTAIRYGGDLGGILTVINQSDEPIVVGPQGLFHGKVRVDASLTGGLDRKVSNLLTRVCFGEQIIPPRRSITTQLPLITGQLREVLMSHPQAPVNVGIHVYIDPAQREDGLVWNRLVDVEPVHIQVGRPGEQITEKSLRTQYNAIALTDPKAMIHTAELFVGLLKEQQIKSEFNLRYTIRYEDWLPGFLKSALTDPAGLLLSSRHWEVKVHTLASMQALELDNALLEVLSQNLRDDAWPVRFQAVALVAQNSTPGVDKLLAWTSKHDLHPIVRSLATLFTEQFQSQP